MPLIAPIISRLSNQPPNGDVGVLPSTVPAASRHPNQLPQADLGVLPLTAPSLSRLSSHSPQGEAGAQARSSPDSKSREIMDWLGRTNPSTGLDTETGLDVSSPSGYEEALRKQSRLLATNHSRYSSHPPRRDEPANPTADPDSSPLNPQCPGPELSRPQDGNFDGDFRYSGVNVVDPGFRDQDVGYRPGLTGAPGMKGQGRPYLSRRSGPDERLARVQEDIDGYRNQPPYPRGAASQNYVPHPDPLLLQSRQPPQQPDFERRGDDRIRPSPVPNSRQNPPPHASGSWSTQQPKQQSEMEFREPENIRQLQQQLEMLDDHVTSPVAPARPPLPRQDLLAETNFDTSSYSVHIYAFIISCILVCFICL